MKKSLFFILSVCLSACKPSDYTYKHSSSSIEEVKRVFKTEKEAAEYEFLMRSVVIRLNVSGGKQCRIDVIKYYDLSPAQKQILNIFEPESDSFECIWIDNWNWVSKRGGLSMTNGVFRINDTTYERSLDISSLNLLQKR
jgi:hypothetical protein